MGFTVMVIMVYLGVIIACVAFVGMRWLVGWFRDRRAFKRYLKSLGLSDEEIRFYSKITSK